MTDMKDPIILSIIAMLKEDARKNGTSLKQFLTDSLDGAEDCGCGKGDECLTVQIINEAEEDQPDTEQEQTKSMDSGDTLDDIIDNMVDGVINSIFGNDSNTQTEPKSEPQEGNSEDQFFNAINDFFNAADAEEEFNAILPDWAARAVKVGDDLETMTQLLTRNGQVTGNATVFRITIDTHTHEPRIYVITDARNIMVLTMNEVIGMFHPPKYVLKDFPNNDNCEVSDYLDNYYEENLGF